MNSFILTFFDTYKNLDILCKQLFSCENGISKYISEMECNPNGNFLIPDWDEDYKQLKHLRWVRNQLAHEIDSFDKNLFYDNDIKWLEYFRSRIIECKDPLALLYQFNQQRIKASVKKNINNYSNGGTDKPQKSKRRIWGRVFGYLILIALIILFVILIGKINLR